MTAPRHVFYISDRLRVPGVVIENIATTAKTLPDFVGLWNNMLGQLEGSR